MERPLPQYMPVSSAIDNTNNACVFMILLGDRADASPTRSNSKDPILTWLECRKIGNEWIDTPFQIQSDDQSKHVYAPRLR